MKDKSKAIVDSAPYHEALIPQYDNVLNELMPGSASNSDEVKALKDEVGSLKSQLAEAIFLLKEKAKQTNIIIRANWTTIISCKPKGIPIL